jgi:hypothetical protein
VHWRLNCVEKVIFVAPKWAFSVKTGVELPKMSAGWHDKMSPFPVFSTTLRLPTSIRNIFFSCPLPCSMVTALPAFAPAGS